MVDTRFHSFAGARPLSELLEAIGFAQAIDGAARIVDGAEELHLAGPEHLSLAAHASYRSALRHTAAGVVIVSPDLKSDVPAGTLAILADDPHSVFARLLDELYPADTRSTVTALLGPREGLPLTEADVRIGPGVVLGPGVEIGRGTVIGPNSVIGAGVTIGRNSVIGSNCSIECAYLGNDVVLHAGARIGAEGFGWLDHGRSNRKIPQLGRVIIQDRVEIGANSAVDRGALGDTVIGEGTKIDNLVQIGHNCHVGRNCLIAGTTALAGSTTLEDSVLMGGGSASTGHLTIGAGSVISALTGVTKDMPAGSILGGFPARDVREWRRETAALRRLAKGDKSGR